MKADEIYVAHIILRAVRQFGPQSVDALSCVIGPISEDFDLEEMMEKMSDSRLLEKDCERQTYSLSTVGKIGPEMCLRAKAA